MVVGDAFSNCNGISALPALVAVSSIEMIIWNEEPNFWVLTRPPSEPIGDKNRSLGKRQGNTSIVRVCLAANRRVRKRCQVSESQACDEG
jgi:hypothetical protein